MKNKIFSLIFGMIVILVSMAVTSTVRYELKNGNEISEAIPITARVQTLLYSPAEVQAPATLTYKTVADDGDWGFVKAGNQVEVDEQTDIPLPDTDPGSGLMTWQNILSLLLTVVSTFFGVYWNKASTTLRAISDALEDKRVTTGEIQNIVNSWKGK
jgi:hypothetical protein